MRTYLILSSLFLSTLAHAINFDKCFSVSFSKEYMEAHPQQIARTVTFGLGSVSAIGINFEEMRGFMDATNNGSCIAQDEKFYCDMTADKGRFTVVINEDSAKLEITQVLFLDYQVDYGQPDTWYQVALKPGQINGVYELKSASLSSCHFLFDSKK